MLSLVFFDRPSLVYAGRAEPPSSACSTGESWVAELAGRAPAEGVILPLEARDSAGCRETLYGVELLRWLRWAASPPWNELPVFAFAFQSLQAILQRWGEAYLFGEGLVFHRLPEALVELPGWIGRAHQRSLKPASSEEMKARFRSSLGGVATTHHDLANDYYAAWRLWVGYGRALKDAARSALKPAERNAIENEIIRVGERRFEWEPGLTARLRTPSFRQFQVLREAFELPRYAPVEEGDGLVRMHASQGLPARVRVMLIDDELEKGLAEVLLDILFGEPQFTRCCDGQRVWCEELPSSPANAPMRRWARFVAAPDVETAACWLVHWGEAKATDLGLGRMRFESWINRWAEELGSRQREEFEQDSSREVLGENQSFLLDSASVWPSPVTTVLLLDLRLSRDPRGKSYNPAELDSVKLRRALRSGETNRVPVLMFTASRQIQNFTEVVEDPGGIDGWLIKEAPDAPADDGGLNSSKALQYLLERVHLFATLKGWYREDFHWDTGRILAYAKLHNSRERDLLLAGVAARAGEIFRELRSGALRPTVGTYETFHQFLASSVAPRRYEIERLLVARRVVLAALLETCDVTGERLEWNTEAFHRFVPGRPLKANLKNIYDKFSFNQELWMRTGNLLTQLLAEELQWLRLLEWPDKKARTIGDALAAESDRRRD